MDLIEATTVTSGVTDITLNMLESKRQAAITEGNQELEAYYNNEITKVIAAEKAEKAKNPQTNSSTTQAQSTGKQQPQTQGNSLGW